MYRITLKCLYLLQEEQFFFEVFFELHWVLPYHALNSEFAIFEIPCVLFVFKSIPKVLSRAINFGRQCHFKICLDCHKFKIFPCLIMPMSTNCQKNEKKLKLMSYNMMKGYNI
jgi:hypothetical protein